MFRISLITIGFFSIFSLGIASIKIIQLKSELKKSNVVQENLIKLQKKNNATEDKIKQAKEKIGDEVSDFKAVLDLLFKNEKNKQGE
ncbi:hypothetical protein LW135_06740 [Helicobacter sp. faydin-H20]|uniref:hypothetical protein n=1 Tax=Helicobacter anatolicus TaxID=2905874 RepID=UPI001E3D2FD9|nr:hypothetical protein [Helicobacter anatolicus]MCE3037516.1 hypothetical protein [Helicobacter anatolicus]